MIHENKNYIVLINGVPIGDDVGVDYFTYDEARTICDNENFADIFKLVDLDD